MMATKKTKKIETNDDYQKMVNKKPARGAWAMINPTLSSMTVGYECSCGHRTSRRGTNKTLYECPECGKRYAVSSVLTMIPLKKDAVEFIERKGRAGDFKP